MIKSGCFLSRSAWHGTTLRLLAAPGAAGAAPAGAAPPAEPAVTGAAGASPGAALCRASPTTCAGTGAVAPPSGGAAASMARWAGVRARLCARSHRQQDSDRAAERSSGASCRCREKLRVRPTMPTSPQSRSGRRYPPNGDTKMRASAGMTPPPARGNTLRALLLSFGRRVLLLAACPPHLPLPLFTFRSWRSEHAKRHARGEPASLADKLWFPSLSVHPGRAAQTRTPRPPKLLIKFSGHYPANSKASKHGHPSAAQHLAR